MDKDQLKNLETSVENKSMELEAQQQDMKATTALQTMANTLRQEVEGRSPQHHPHHQDSRAGHSHYQSHWQ